MTSETPNTESETYEYGADDLKKGFTEVGPKTKADAKDRFEPGLDTASAGQVTVRKADGTVEIQDPYSSDQLLEIMAPVFEKKRRKGGRKPKKKA